MVGALGGNRASLDPSMYNWTTVDGARPMLIIG
jgi:hypothetical protein